MYPDSVPGPWTDGVLQWSYSTLADLGPIAAMLRKPAVCEHVYFGPNTREETEAYFGPLIEGMQEELRHGDTPRNHLFTIRDGEGTFLGDCAAVTVPYAEGNYIVGYQLDEPHWRQGFGRRTGEFLEWFCLDLLGARRLSADCLASNVGSARILEQIGFTPEGVRREYYTVNGEPRDDLQWGLLRSEVGPGRIARLRDRFAPSAS